MRRAGCSRSTCAAPQATKAWSVLFAGPLSKRGCAQANRVTLANSCRCNNSSGDDFARHSRLARLVKFFARGVESFTHHRNHFRFESSGLYEWTNWHGRYPPPQLRARPKLEMERGDSQVQFGQRPSRCDSLRLKSDLRLKSHLRSPLKIIAAAGSGTIPLCGAGCGGLHCHTVIRAVSALTFRSSCAEATGHDGPD